MLRRIAVLLVAVALIMGMFSAYAVQTDVTATFYEGVITMADHQIGMVMDDEWFNAPSTQYNHSLAQLSLVLACAAFRKNTTDYAQADEYLRDFFDQAGFEDYAAYDFDLEPNKSTIANGIAHRHMRDEKGDYVLLAVPISGQGYGNEWISNFSVGGTEEHNGFESSANKVYDRMAGYIQRYLPGERIKIWTCGFSRAAATSNYLGHLLLSQELFEPDGVFVYTFGTPNNTKNPVAWPQIFNICNAFDVVPKIPFAEWGFGKHGTTLYLPSAKTNAHYNELFASAQQVYTSVMGQSEGFAPSRERNWLMEEILFLLYMFIPEAQVYSDGYQEALIAAWETKGTAGDKLNALLNTVKENGSDTSGVERVQGELAFLVESILNQTSDVLVDKNADSTWPDILLSGKLLLHEHLTVMYVSWMFSTDDPEKLFGEYNYFRRCVVTGDVDPVVTRIDPERGEEAIVYSRSEGITEIDVLSSDGVHYIDMPADPNFRVEIAPKDTTAVKVMYYLRELANVDSVAWGTNSCTLCAGDKIRVDISRDAEGSDTARVALNDALTLDLHANDYLADVLEAKNAATPEYGDFDLMFANVVVMVPYAGSSIALLIYALVVIIRRLRRGSRQDHLPAKGAARVILIIVSAMAAATFVYNVVALIRILLEQNVVLENRTLELVSELLGVGRVYYTTYNCVVHGLMALIAFRSLRRRISRVRLFRLSVLMMLLNVLSLYLSFDLNTFTNTFALFQLMPIAAVIAVIISAEQERREQHRPSEYKPIIIASVWMLILFILYQVLLWYFGRIEEVTLLKIIIGFPAVFLALRMWLREKTGRRLLTMIAVFVYMLANVLINLSLIAGIILYIAGHVILVIGFVRTKKPVLWQYLLWAALTLLCCGELLLLKNSGLPAEVMTFGMIYAAMISAVVAASLRVSKNSRLGSIVFMIGNELLVLTYVYPASFALHCMELLIFYIAVMLLIVDDRTEIAEQ